MNLGEALFSLEFERAVLRDDLDPVAGLEVAGEQPVGERVEHEILDCAPERAGTELGIEAFFREDLFRGLVHFEGELLLGEPFLKLLELDLHDLAMIERR